MTIADLMTGPSSERAAAGAAATDALRLFLEEVRHHPPLSADRTRELFRRLERGDLAARETLILSNLGLVVSVAKRQRGPQVALLDLIQDGVLGLIRAVDRFEWRRGYRFSTYATWWIQHAIQRAVAGRAGAIRIPIHVGQRAARLQRAETALAARFGRAPTAEELAAAAQLTVEQVRAVRRAPRIVVSLDQPVGSAGETPLAAVLVGAATGAEPTLPIGLERAALHEALQHALAHLPERERRLIGLRYGLAGAEPLTLEATGRRLGLSRERIRQLEQDALDRLAHEHELQALRPAVETGRGVEPRGAEVEASLRGR